MVVTKHESLSQKLYIYNFIQFSAEQIKSGTQKLLEEAKAFLGVVITA